MASLRVQVRLVCPVCGHSLPTLAKFVEDTQASWVLTSEAREHLGSHS